MKTLYIHIGTPKTGTTAIQYFCTNNAKLLEDKGYYYPDMPYRYEGKNWRRNGTFLEARLYTEDKKRNRKKENEIFEEGLKSVVDMFKKHDNVILSDEGIWWSANVRRKTTWQEIKDAADKYGFKVCIIVYLRRQDQFIDSWHNQRIKRFSGNRTSFMTFDDCINNYQDCEYLDYYDGVKKIADVFGKDSVIVKSFDRNKLKNGSVIDDFMDLFGIEVTEEYMIPKTLNEERFTSNMLSIKTVLNELPKEYRDEDLFFQYAMTECAPVCQKYYDNTFFTNETAKDFMKKFDEGNALVAKEFLNSDEPLFNDKYNYKEQWSEDNDYFQDDIIRVMGANDLYLQRMIVKQNEEINLLKKEVSRLKRAIKHPISSLIKMIIRHIKG